MSMGCLPTDALAEVPYGDIYKNINSWKKKEKEFKDSHDGNQAIDGEWEGPPSLLGTLRLGTDACTQHMHTANRHACT